MGNLINPISERLGTTRYWNSNWTQSQLNNYSFLANEDLLANRYIMKIVKICDRRLMKQKATTLVSHRLIRQDNLTQLILSIKIAGIFRLRRVTKRYLKLILKNNAKKLLIRRKKACRKTQHSRKIRKPSKLLSEKRLHKLPTTEYLDKELLNTSKIGLARIADAIARSPSFTPYITSTKAYDQLVRNSSSAKRIYLSRESKNQNKHPYKRFFVLWPLIIRKVIFNLKLISLKNFIKSALSKFFKNNAVSVVFIIQASNSLTAEFIAQYIVARLKNNFPIRKLIKTTISQLRRFAFKSQIAGFKLVCSGRFERRGRASYAWKTLAKVPNTNQKIKLDYAMRLVTLTNSLCAVKVWLAFSKQTKKLLII